MQVTKFSKVWYPKYDKHSIHEQVRTGKIDMADLVYRAVMRDLKQKILAHQYPKMKLPDERTLSADYEVSRSTIKRALDVLVQQGIIFKKRGSGTFINPLYLKNQAMFSYGEQPGDHR